MFVYPLLRVNPYLKKSLIVFVQYINLLVLGFDP